MKSKDFNLSCPAPLRHYPQIVMGHGSGGQIMQDLIQHLIGSEFFQDNSPLTDSAVINIKSHQAKSSKLAFTTDSFVISPQIFPGGDIGSLAVHGTVNDLAVMGAVPYCISVAYILEEGLPLSLLHQVTHSLSQAAKKAGVQIVTGDTKVVEKGHGDQIFINTTGIGFIEKNISLHPKNIKPGDKLIVNGNLGDHGIAIMALRHGIKFDTPILSDSAPLHTLIQSMLKVSSGDIHVIRDITRGGLASVGNELAKDSNTCFFLNENSVPVNRHVASACEILGLDPFHVANEGKLLAVVSNKSADKVLSIMKKHPLGKKAAIIGEVGSSPKGAVIGRTVIGGERVIDFPTGELLPRIC